MKQHFSLIGILLFSTLTFANPMTGEIFYKGAQQKPFNSNIKLLIQDYSYKEPGLMEITGTLNGLEYEISKTDYQKRIFYGANVSYVSGEGRYNGSLINYETGERQPWSQDDQNWIATTHLLIGKNVLQDDILGSFISFSGGLGYRFLNNKSNPPYPVERDQVYWYLPLAAHWAQPLTNNLIMRYGIEFDIFIRGNNTTKSNSGERKYVQKSGGGNKFSAALIQKLPTTQVTYELYYQSWRIADSEPVMTNITDEDGNKLYFHEPKNETDVIGLSIGLIF